MQVLVDGLMTHYSRLGKGQPVLLLHGWADSSAGLRALQERMSGQFDVIAVDLPGFGGTSAPVSAWDLADYATFVGHFIQKIGVNKLYAVLGHSNGGAIAIYGIGNERFAAQKLILLASSGIRHTQEARNGVLKVIAKTGKAVAVMLPRSAKGKLRKKFYDAIGSDMLVAENMQETFKRVVDQDISAEASRIKVPTLLVYGENDADAPVEQGRRISDLISNSKLLIVPMAGHFIHIDQPEKVYRAIEEFMA